MKKKINLNREKVTSEEIAARRNFDAILSSYSSTVPPKAGKPFFRSMGFAAGSIIAVIAGLTAAWWFTRPSTPQQAQQQVLDEQFNNTTYKPASTASRLFINRPYSNLDVKFSSYIVNAARGGELTHPSGTKIRIPANAFAGQDGKAVDGKVELKYREFRDPVDFLVSGIPMSYDSAGTTWQFESAGMMEILAYKDGQQLNVNDGKIIEVEMPSKYDGSKYNLYQLDTAARNWIYKGKDKIKREPKSSPVTEEHHVITSADVPAAADEAFDAAQQPEVKKIETEIAAIKKDIEKIEQQKPKEPAKAHSDRHKFNLEVDPKEFPEIAVYKGMVFEVGAENKNFSKEMYKVVWDDAVLSEGSKKGVNYKLTLTKGEDKKTIIVYPVLTGKNYEAALAEYNDKFKKYESALSVRKADEKKKEEEYKEAVKKAQQEHAARQKAAEEQRKAWAEEQRQRAERERIEARNAITNYNNITRVFMVSGFGVWNSDSPFKHTDPVRVAAEFSCSDTALNVSKVYHIDRTKNTLFTIYDRSFSRFEYSPSSANVVFVTLPGNRLAVFNEKDFASLPKKDGAYNFNMKAVEKEFTSVEDLKQYLLSSN